MHRGDITFHWHRDPIGYEVKPDIRYEKNPDRSDREVREGLAIWEKSAIGAAETTWPLTPNPVTGECENDGSVLLVSQLAEVELTKAGLEKWCNRHGLLFTGEERLLRDAKGFLTPGCPNNRVVNLVESYKDPIRQAKAFMAFLSMMQTGIDPGYISPHPLAKALEAHGVPTNRFPGLGYLNIFEASPEWEPIPPAWPGQEFKPDDVPLMAQRILWSFLFKVLKEKVNLVSVVEQTGMAERMALRPVDFEAAIWLQASFHLHEGKHARVCPICNKVYEVSAETPKGPTSQRYCGGRSSKTCKVRANERRRDKAFELFKAGANVQEVLEQVNGMGFGVSKRDTIEGWRAKVNG
jgi:hypothetical protein